MCSPPLLDIVNSFILMLFVEIRSANSILRPYAGETERLMREAFAEAKTKAGDGHPSIIFIDEIDALCPPRDARCWVFHAHGF